MRRSCLKRTLKWAPVILFSCLVAVAPNASLAFEHVSSTTLSWMPVLDVARCGNVVYIASMQQPVQIVDCTDPDAPILCGQIPQDTTGRQVVVDGEWLYVLTETGFIDIFSVTDPANPVCMGSAHAGGPWDRDFDCIAVDGGTLVQATRVGGATNLFVFDVSTPEIPVLLSTVSLSNPVLSVVLSGRYLYVADESGGVRIYDLVDRSNPVELSNYVTGRFNAMCYDNGYLYCIVDYERLYILDVSDREDPRFSRMVTIGGYPWLMDLYKDGDALYLLGYEIDVVDVSTPSNATLLSHLDLDDGIVSAVVIGDRLIGGCEVILAFPAKFYFVESAHGFLRLFDIANPENVTLLSTSFGNPQGQHIATGNGYAYLVMTSLYGDEPDGMWIANLADPDNPSIEGWMPVPRLVEDIALNDSTLYTFQYDTTFSGLVCYSVSDPLHPAQVSELPLVHGWFTWLRVFDSLVVVGGGLGINLVDVSNLTEPVLLATIPEEGYGADLQDGYLYVVTYNSMKVYDLHDLPNIELLTEWESDEILGWDVRVQGDRAFIVNSGPGWWGSFYATDLLVADISIPSEPFPVYSIDCSCQMIEIDGDTLYAAGLWSGVSVWDVSDPFTATQVWNYPTMGMAIELALDDGNLYSISSYNLDVFRNNEAAVPEWPITASPRDFDLSLPWPNPFNATTTLALQMQQPGRVTFEVFDILGRLVRCDTHMIEAGRYRWTLDGAGLASGTYLVRATAPTGRTIARKISLVR